VVLQRYESTWRDDHVVVKWLLLDMDGVITFDVNRQRGDGRFEHPDTRVVSDGGGDYHFDDANIERGDRYTYRVSVMQDSEPVTSFETAVETPASVLALGPNRSNPFNPTTEIPFTVDRARRVRLHIY